MDVRRLVATAALATAPLLCAGPASAHHSFAMFDFSKNVDLVGTIEEFRWANPHIHIVVSAAGAQGQAQSWDIEGGTPNSLRPRGWSRDTFKKGQKVRLVIHPLKNGEAGGSLVGAFREDGSAVGAAPAPAR